MGGRDRSGDDALGSIGDIEEGIELIDDEKPKKPKKRIEGHEVGSFIMRKGTGLGLLAIVVGAVMWMWPIFDRAVLYYIKTEGGGMQYIMGGITLIVAAVLARIILPPIINLLLR